MKEKIRKKIEELKKVKEQFLAQLNAVNGAIQCAEELLVEEAPNVDIKQIGEENGEHGK